MGRIEEQFLDIYNTIPKAMSPVDLMQNVRELMSRHGINSTQAMSMSYAIAVNNPEMSDDTKECLKRFLRSSEVEESEKYRELLKSLDEKAGMPSPEGFQARYTVYVTPWGSPPKYAADYRQIQFLGGDQEAFATFKFRLKNSAANEAFKSIFNKQADSKEELIDMLQRDLTEKGFGGTLVITDTTTAEKTTHDLEPEPQAEPVTAESNIRRETVDNGREFIEALEELDALTGRKPVVAESQRPAVKDVIGTMEEDLKKAVLVRLAEMFRGLGYEEYPIDEEGKQDIENVMESVSKELKEMSQRIGELIKGQIEAIKAGPEKYTENLSRWLAGQSAIVDEEEDEEEGAMDEKKAKLSKETQEFISAEISKLVKSGMDQKQAIAAAYSAAREKGMKVPKAPKEECGEESPEGEPVATEPEPELEPGPENVPAQEPQVALESKKAKK